MRRSLPMLLGLLAAACGAPTPTTGGGGTPPGQVSSVTVYPVVLAGHPNERVAEVVGVMLERSGLRVELADDPFRPAKGDVQQQAAAFAAEVDKRGLQTDCALFAAYEGSPDRGVDEIRSALVDKDGKVVWTDRQQPGDAEFDRVSPKDPMSCTVLLVDRLRDPLHIQGAQRSEEGPIEARLRQRSLAPADEEYAAMDRRAAKLAKSIGDGEHPTVLVLPVLQEQQWSTEDARMLAQRVADLGLRPTVADAPMRFQVTADSNEQTVLWSAARSLQKLVRASPPDADYVLAADFVIEPVNQTVWAVHTFLLDRDGNWVVVDFQNSHHDDFQAAAPDSPEDCSELSAKRLRRKLQ